MSQEEVIVVNAENQILGRLSSIVAKMLLEGKKVIIVNAEKAVISGSRDRIVEGYKKLWEVRTLRNPEKQGPRRPQKPSNILKKTIKGMLPRKPKGKEALSNLKVYIGVPKELQGRQFVSFEEASAKKLKGKYITVKELSESLGWRGGL